MKRVTKLAVVLAALAAFAAEAQTYPSKPVKIVVGFAPGGGSDFAARVIAQQLTERLKSQVIVENKPGAGSLIGAEFVIKSAPDGYTLLLTPASYTVNPSVYKLSFDPLNDITPIAQISKGPYIVAVHPSVPAKTLKELVDYAKANPGKLSYASSGNGAHIHVATEYLLYTAGINIVHVPYKGSGPALNDTVGGQVQMIFGSVATALQYVKSGRLRPLAVTTPKRIAARARRAHRRRDRATRAGRSPTGTASSVPRACPRTSSSASTRKSTWRCTPSDSRRCCRATASSPPAERPRSSPPCSKRKSRAGRRW